ncbi:Glutamyl-tRNA (Gln) amidotransferase subunit A [Gossypium arboreum]|uniref:Glutamyl-tRNA (Gln) amidotransferase subunit A n=1 Tax=Gossypium arboreum TaxID=29729 RepID=A0A0B0MGQ5_GOSAR|nr:Glutamyl-tRNA (Gln) amidotransferase subunit A [Gossypium arboreum]
MNTTVGSYALLGSVVGWDAGVVEKLRNVGAVILGKAILTEWYSFRALGKTPNGWCARGGQAQILVDQAADQHIRGRQYGDHFTFGLKPTVGLTSRAGVVPISSRQDTIGPMARTVVDAVHLLNAIVGFDPRDSEATSETAQFIPDGGYKQFLNEDGIIGKRLGVVRHPYLDTLNRSTVSTFENHLELLRSGELMLLQAEFKSSVNEYLKELAISFVRSLADIIDFNQNNPELEKLEEYGQQTLIESERTNGIGEKERKAAEYLEKLSWDGFEKKMKDYKLDALVTPDISLAMTVLAIGGYPGISVEPNTKAMGCSLGFALEG